MKLGTLKSTTSRDGQLIVVSRDNKKYVPAFDIAPNLREALENWAIVAPKLQKKSDELNAGKCKDVRDVRWEEFHSPLPRAFQWADGSAFLHHVKLVRQARKAPIPETIYKVPLMYQGGSDDFLAPTDDIPQIDFEYGTDFEGEVAVITDAVPMGVQSEEALSYIRLIVLVNDVTLRGLIPDELAQGFGFFQSKPSSTFSPLALTTDEIGPAWRDGRVHLPLHVEYNNEFFGKANAGQMHFHFGQLIAHAARTRALGPGTIIGSGTVSNDDANVGSSCLVEKRMLEQIHDGVSKTSYMKAEDSVKIYMLNEQNQNLFGSIEQKVKKVR